MSESDVSLIQVLHCKATSIPLFSLYVTSGLILLPVRQSTLRLHWTRPRRATSIRCSERVKIRGGRLTHSNTEKQSHLKEVSPPDVCTKDWHLYRKQKYLPVDVSHSCGGFHFCWVWFTGITNTFQTVIGENKVKGSEVLKPNQWAMLHHNTKIQSSDWVILHRNQWKLRWKIEVLVLRWLIWNVLISIMALISWRLRRQVGVKEQTGRFRRCDECVRSHGKAGSLDLVHSWVPLLDTHLWVDTRWAWLCVSTDPTMCHLESVLCPSLSNQTAAVCKNPNFSPLHLCVDATHITAITVTNTMSAIMR